MPLDLKTLAQKTLGDDSDQTPSLIYQPSTSTDRTAIVHAMRFTNTGSGAAQIHLFFLKSGGTYSGGSSEKRRLLPADLVLAPGHTLIDNDELTLGPGDAIHAHSDVDSVIDVVISGSERPA